MSLSSFLNKVTHKSDNNRWVIHFLSLHSLWFECWTNLGGNAESDLEHHPHLHCNQWRIPPYLGDSNERRNSLPSPSATFNQEEGFFKSGLTPPVLNFGNISPGDGPLPIRPYHAIIEGSDKWVNSFTTAKSFTVWVIQRGKSLLMLMFYVLMLINIVLGLWSCNAYSVCCHDDRWKQVRDSSHLCFI